MLTLMKNYWWFPLVIIVYVLYSIASKKNNELQTQFWFWATFFIGALPLWTWVSKYSKNLIFDGLLYDAMIILVYIATMAVLGAGSDFKACNWIGVIIIVIGFILVKI